MVIFLTAWLACSCAGAAFSADLAVEADIPAPPAFGERGIWGAIAYSQPDGKHGFFWGADKRDEAEAVARKHCERTGGGACDVVSVFRNHRHWDDDDGSGFPYNHCAALAVGQDRNGVIDGSAFAAKSATTRNEAETLSLAECQASGSKCRIREWVCT
ncbi:DUF4189 domain-containing protein [Ciceribacter sp. RN22]|nr:DUF4189 domain-containing protein [Ciceribacter sp. RN22]MCO6181000.1 DUF4189 domain-containing protein [Ciceribacter sp. RN22]